MTTYQLELRTSIKSAAHVSCWKILPARQAKVVLVDQPLEVFKLEMITCLFETRCVNKSTQRLVYFSLFSLIVRECADTETLAAETLRMRHTFWFALVLALRRRHHRYRYFNINIISTSMDATWMDLLALKRKFLPSYFLSHHNIMWPDDDD